MGPDRHEIARRFPGMLLPRGGYVAVLMEAYMDESVPESGRSPFMIVGGYLFYAKQAEAFSTQWSRYLADKGLPFFRMSDCAHGRGVFEGWDIPSRDKVARSLITRVKQKASFGFAASIDHSEHEQIFGRYQEMPGAYTLACFACMMLIRRWAEKHNYDGDIAYTFEAGHEDKGEADAFIKRMMKDERKRKDYRYISHTFALKEKVPLLQTGDLLAWQSNKGYVNMLGGRPIRKDFQALLRPGDRMMEYNPEQLRILEAALLEDSKMLTLRSSVG